MGLKYVGVVEVPSALIRNWMYAGLLFSLIAMTFKSTLSFSCFALSHYGFMLHGDIPWFNFRATQYMSDHGWHAFFSWFDDMSWYPLGRPVGSTTYPGLQITAVAIHRALNSLGMDISLNDLCVLMPVGVGLVGMALIGALAYELSGSLASATASILFLSTVPAYAISSLAGEFDAAGLCMALMLLTFYLWVRSLRCPRSWPIGVLAGLAYGALTATWAGHVFALVLVAAHAAVSGLADLSQNRCNPALLRAYALFYIVGTAIATRVPPVGMAPFTSLEQLSALLVLVLLFGLWVGDAMCVGCAGHGPRSLSSAGASNEADSTTATTKAKSEAEETQAASEAQADSEAVAPAASRQRVLPLRVCMSACVVIALFLIVQVGVSAGLINAPSAQLRAILPGFLGGRSLASSAAATGRSRSPLLVLRERDFNGEVESVWSAVLTPYFLWMTYMMVSMTQLYARLDKPVDVFAPLLSAAGLFIGMRVRASTPVVVIAACLAAGLAGGWAYDVAVSAMLWDPETLPEAVTKAKEARAAHEAEVAAAPPAQRNSLRFLGRRAALDMQSMKAESPFPALLTFSSPLLMILVSLMLTQFRDGAISTVFPYMHPGITFHAMEGNEPVRVEDYYEGYTWLHSHTPADARVMAWHPHGYQLNAIANRTSLVDGNTWNHEQLALVAKMFTAPVTEAHALVRHMADYVLIWAGKDGPQDIYQAPFMALMANALFGDVCAGDPACRLFTFSDEEMTRPRPLLKQSLIYSLHQHKVDARKPFLVNPELFEEVYTSPRGLARIFKVLDVSAESKQWMADPAHRACRPAPDQWICPGHYPPAEVLEALWSRASHGFAPVDEADLPQMFPKHEEMEEMTA